MKVVISVEDHTTKMASIIVKNTFVANTVQLSAKVMKFARDKIETVKRKSIPREIFSDKESTFENLQGEQEHLLKSSR